jgi:hypothetical protein
MDVASLLFPAMAISLLADQACKVAVLSSVGGESAERRGVIRPVITGRPLAARAGIPPAVLALAWLAFVAAAALAPAAGWFDSAAARIGLGMALGGAAGNLLDLAVRGGVLDFIDLRVWPAFNLADVAIVSGVVLALGAG